MSDPLLYLDTLALAGTDLNQEDAFSLDSSTLKSDRPKLTKRARAKYLTRALAIQLADLGTDLQKSYTNSIYCCHHLKQEGDYVHAKYCKNRWCIVCNRIRTAKLIRDYQPVLDAENDKYLVTLTIPNVPADSLPSAIKQMQKAFSEILDLSKKRASRFGTPSLRGLRKLECTFNPERNDFHPHYHVVLFSRQGAVDLLHEWLKRFPAATTGAQDIRPADSNSMRELFKYFTKVITKPKTSRDGKVYIEALDTIFRAMKGRDVFRAFGGFRPSKHQLTEEEIQKQLKQLEEIDDDMEIALWVWSQMLHDWVNPETGKLLTGYQPTQKFEELVQSLQTQHKNRSVYAKGERHTRT